MVIAHWSQSEDAAVRSQLERILECEIFSQGERQSRFLRYIVEKTLLGEAKQLNQFAVGVDVFDRNASFDPAVDSIVRVEAGRLRAKLTEYYSDIGKNDPVQIRLPKGGYSAEFQFASGPLSPKFAPKIPGTKQHPIGIMAGAIVAVALIVFSALYFDREDPSVSKSKNEPTTNNAVPNMPSIAVLPFDNMSADPGQQYFSDGITEDIITDLSIVSGLRVIARNSTFAYKGKNVSISDIAKDLNVSHVLEGSVRKSGESVRITAQLIDVSTQSHLWADRYDRPINDIFSIQDEVSQRIVSALEIVLTDHEKERLYQVSSGSVSAHDALLRGKELFHRFSPDGVVQSTALFSTAIERNPDYAEAYAWKSRALVFQYIAGISSSKQETVGQALVLANHAVQRDESLPMAYANLAWAMRWNSQLDEAASTIERAVELDPNFADAYLWKSLIHSSMGDGETALEAIEQSIRLNPNYGVTSIFALARAHYEIGELENAVDLFDRGIDRNPNFLPNHVYKVFALEENNRHDEAAMARKTVTNIDPNYKNSASYRYYFLERR